MEVSHTHPAVTCLRSFIREFHEWEFQAARKHEATNWETITEEELEAQRCENRKMLEAIYNRYCEVGTRAKRLQDAGLSFSLVSEFDEERHRILTVVEKAGKVTIETQDPDVPSWKRKYELIQVDGQWRIRDNVKYGSKDSKKWNADLL